MCMCLFPKSAVKNPLPEAARVRKSLYLLAILHLILGIAGIIFVSYKTLLLNVFYIACLYSIHQSLNQGIMWIYMGGLGINTIWGFITVWFMSGTRFFVYFFIIGLYCLCIQRFYMESYQFRNRAAYRPNDGYVKVGGSSSQVAATQGKKNQNDNERYQNLNDPLFENHWINQLNQQNAQQQPQSKQPLLANNKQQQQQDQSNGRVQMMDRLLNEMKKP